MAVGLTKRPAIAAPVQPAQSVPTPPDENSLEAWQAAAGPGGVRGLDPPDADGGENPYSSSNPSEKPTKYKVNERGYAVPVEEPSPDKKASNTDIVYPTALGSDSGAVQAPQIIPAHEVALVNPTRQLTEQDTYAAQMRGVEKQRGALDEQKAAADRIADAEANISSGKVKGDQHIADVSNAAQRETEDSARDAKRSQDDFRSRLDQFSQALANDRIGVDVSLPRKVTWSLASALGAVQQGLLRLPTNQIADRIDSEIRQEIENQKANHAIQRGRLQDLDNFYSHAVAQSKDQAERQKLAHGYALEAAKAEAQAFADAAGTPLAQAKADEIKARLTEKQGQLDTHEGELATVAVQRGIAENKWVPAGPAGGTGKPVDSKNVFFDPITGRHYAAKNEKSRDKLTESGSAVLAFKAAGKQYLDALNDVGFGDKAAANTPLIHYQTDAMSRARTAYNHALSIARKAQHDGVWKPSEAEMLVGTLTPPDHFSGDIPGQLNGLDKATLSVHQANMTTEAADPVVATPQPAGTAPKNIPTGQNYAAPRAITPSSQGFTPAGAKAHGGNVSNNQPYLVGEKGPELVVPNKPGFVLTALQTAALRGAPPTEQQMRTLPPGARSAVQRFAEREGVARCGGGYMVSDARAKEEAFQAGVRAGHSQAAESLDTRANEAVNSGILGIATGTPVGGALGLRQVLGAGYLSAARNAEDERSEAPLPRQPRQVADGGAHHLNVVTATHSPALRTERDLAIPEPMPQEDPNAPQHYPRWAETGTARKLVVAHPPEVAARAPSSPGPDFEMEHVSRRPPPMPIAGARADGGAMQEDANRRGQGHVYAYKDGLGPSEQVPGELNYGPMAQELEKNPLTATTVKQDPQTGLKVVDKEKLLKSNTAGIASLQQQIDELKGVPRREDGGAFDYDSYPQQSNLRDPRAFVRDMPAQQAQVKRAYEDDAARRADEMMAEFRQSLAQGPATHNRPPSVENVMHQAEALRQQKDAEYAAALAQPSSVHPLLAHEAPQAPPEWLEQYMQGEPRDEVAMLPARAQGGAMQPRGLAASISRDLKKTKRAC